MNASSSTAANRSDPGFEALQADLCLLELQCDATGRPRGFRRLPGHGGAQARASVGSLAPDDREIWLPRLARVVATGRPECFETRLAPHGRRLLVRVSRAGDASSRQLAVLLTELTDDADYPGNQPDFVATVAHELRNFLAPLSSGVEILRADAEPGTLRRLLPMMERQIEHMTGLLQDLVGGAAGSRGAASVTLRALQVQSIAAQAIDAVAPALARREQHLSIELPDTPLWVCADPLRLAQVLANLLTNAIKYTPPGGSIRLTACADDDEACIVVADRGIGIPAEELPGVFDMYRQVPGHAPLSQGGRGIGLWVVKRLVEAQGGTVLARSAGTGQGSSFVVRLPLHRPRAADRRTWGFAAERGQGYSARAQ